MKKAPIAVALVLVFGLFAAAFSLAPAIAQNTPSNSTGMAGDSTTTATSNATTTGNTTGTSGTNATGGETFSARGSIAALIFDTGETSTGSEAQNDTTTSTAGNDTSMTGNATTSGNTTTSGNATTMMPQVMTGDNATGSSNMTGSTGMTSDNATSMMSNETTTSAESMMPPYVLAGDWNLDFQNGNVSEFAATFTMVHIDGTGRHTHELSDFVSSNSSTIDSSENGTSFIFGTVDVGLDGQEKWTGVDALIIIEKSNVVSISLASEDSDDHFQGQPIYGIVESMTDENGNEMIDTGTSTAGNQTGGAAGGNQTAGNQTDGGILSNLTSGISDLFDGEQ